MKTHLLVIACLLGFVAPSLAQTDYVVGSQDVLTITVFGEPELTGKYTVERPMHLGAALAGRA